MGENGLTKQEFIDGYTTRSGIAKYKTADGYHAPGRQPVVALPCACGDEMCLGWAMVREDDIAEHMRLYAPLRPRTKAETLLKLTENGNRIERDATAFLGLEESQAEELFRPSNVRFSKWTDITPAHAVAVLRHLAETGEVDWSVGAP